MLCVCGGEGGGGEREGEDWVSLAVLGEKTASRMATDQRRLEAGN